MNSNGTETKLILFHHCHITIIDLKNPQIDTEHYLISMHPDKKKEIGTKNKLHPSSTHFKTNALPSRIKILPKRQ